MVHGTFLLHLKAHVTQRRMFYVYSSYCSLSSSNNSTHIYISAFCLLEVTFHPCIHGIVDLFHPKTVLMRTLFVFFLYRVCLYNESHIKEWHIQFWSSFARATYRSILSPTPESRRRSCNLDKKNALILKTRTKRDLWFKATHKTIR